jgi:hypothetical protein
MCVNLSVYLSKYLYVYLSKCHLRCCKHNRLSVYLSICLFVYLLICLSPSAYLTLRIPIDLSVCPNVYVNVTYVVVDKYP